MAFGQITSSKSPTKTPFKPQQTEQSEVILDKISNDAGSYFKKGLLSFKKNNRSETAKFFNDSVKVFLMSGVNVRASQKLQDCYSQLIETIYRIEFPSDAQLPQIRSLSSICGWNIENDLADDVAQMVKSPKLGKPNDSNSKTASALINNNAQVDLKVGFTEQKVEISPLDYLAKLELKPKEEQETRRLYVRPVVRANSLGAKPVQYRDGKVSVVMEI